MRLITSIGLGDDDKIVEIYSKQVYTILKSFEVPKVIIETKYKTIDKKIKPIVSPISEDSIEQIREASKERSLRDPKNIGHQFTKETFKKNWRFDVMVLYYQ